MAPFKPSLNKYKAKQLFAKFSAITAFIGLVIIFISFFEPVDMIIKIVISSIGIITFASAIWFSKTYKLLPLIILGVIVVLSTLIILIYLILGVINLSLLIMIYVLVLFIKTSITIRNYNSLPEKDVDTN